MRGQNAATRLVLVNSADKERIGTTGSAPTIGTSTSGINAPVPYPATPPTTEAISAIPAIRTSSSKEMSVKPERTDSSITATLYQPPRSLLSAPAAIPASAATVELWRYTDNDSFVMK